MEGGTLDAPTVYKSKSPASGSGEMWPDAPVRDECALGRVAGCFTAPAYRVFVQCVTFLWGCVPPHRAHALATPRRCDSPQFVSVCPCAWLRPSAPHPAVRIRPCMPPGVELRQAGGLRMHPHPSPFVLSPRCRLFSEITKYLPVTAHIPIP